MLPWLMHVTVSQSTRGKPFDWLPDQGWEDVIKLRDVNAELFGSLADDIEKNERPWKEVSQ